MKMKKLLSILLCAALVLGLAACGTAASDPTAAPELSLIHI